VKHYRVYKRARPMGPIVKGKDLLAPDDGEAMREAMNDQDCPVCDVWQGAKKVGSVL
jgi:hypothetical protein